MRVILHGLGFLFAVAFTQFSGCTVIVNNGNGNVRSVAITPAGPTIPVGGKQQFFANVTFGDGTLLTVKLSDVFWSTSDPKVATINGNGLATGVGPGTATITGTFSGVSGSTSLTATAASNIRLFVSGTASRLEVTFPQSDQRFIYAANPLDGTISILRTDVSTGVGQPIADVSVSPARGPVWLALDPAGKLLFVANHTSSDISVFAIDPASGRLTPVPGSPFSVEGGAWSVCVSPEGQFLLATHLNSPGTTRFRIASATGSLAPEPRP
jgi:DNA-binding beta-propeller fold protein YncE